MVGANESGKSHLLSAIEKGLTGDNITRRDFCRYSQFFTVEEGSMRWPDFGFEFADLTREDQELLRKVAEIKTPGAIDSFTLIRSDRTRCRGHWTSWGAICCPRCSTSTQRLPCQAAFRFLGSVGQPSGGGRAKIVTCPHFMVQAL